ncbi:Kynurenine 3-monooxygenase [Dirofilaria immitis]
MTNLEANRPSSDIMDLLSLDDAASGTNSFASDWSKLTTNQTSSDTVTVSSPIPPSSLTSSLTLPSQLLQFPSVENGFPNPFAESVDPNLDIWKKFLKEFETAGTNENGVYKNC